MPVPRRIRWSGRTLAALAGAILTSGAAFAQPGSPRLQTVDPTVADTGPLSFSARRMPADLRVPTGFEQVYRLPMGSGVPMFARMSGAVTAVFPRSFYTPAGTGASIAEIPAGTVFYIGGVPTKPAANGPTGWATAAHRADLSASRPAGRSASPPRRGSVRQIPVPSRDTENDSTIVSSVFGDESFRARRVQELLDRASKAVAPGPTEPE